MGLGRVCHTYIPRGEVWEYGKHGCCGVLCAIRWFGMSGCLLTSGLGRTPEAVPSRASAMSTCRQGFGGLITVVSSSCLVVCAW